jgi:hypothetical protein
VIPKLSGPVRRPLLTRAGFATQSAPTTFDIGRLFFRLRFCSQLAEVLHHGVGIDLADRAYLFLGFEGALFLELLLTFTQRAAGYIANGAQPTLAFEAGFAFQARFFFASPNSSSSSSSSSPSCMSAIALTSSRLMAMKAT